MCRVVVALDLEERNTQTNHAARRTSLDTMPQTIAGSDIRSGGDMVSAEAPIPAPTPPGRQLSEMSRRLQEGWTLLNYSCPIPACHTPLLKDARKYGHGEVGPWENLRNIRRKNRRFSATREIVASSCSLIQYGVISKLRPKNLGCYYLPGFTTIFDGRCNRRIRRLSRVVQSTMLHVTR